MSVIESIERHYKEVTKQMIGLKNKLEEIEAFEKNQIMALLVYYVQGV